VLHRLSSNANVGPELQYVARLVLAQPSASICERINSEFAFIKDRRRNKLQHEKTNKLVAIFHNLRLLARMNKPNCVEPAVGWNCEDNHVGVIKYGVADYEPRTKSTPISTTKRPELLQSRCSSSWMTRTASRLRG
jgi:hypothetical protein